ncbi:MAG: hypothetical protein GY952_08715 [Rhodobacteraceae bacterium]|nr:hypothetical protein [Paracoccaceae bacterium]
MDFSTDTLVSVLGDLMTMDIRYEMNGMVGKVRNLAGTSPSQIRQLDCSGFVEYVIYRTTLHNHNLPSGSRRQRNFIERDHGEVDYSANASLLDNMVRIGFRDAVWSGRGEDRRRTGVGHVWLVINGITFESTSRGGRTQGPKSFAWDTRVDDADHFFTLGRAPEFRMKYMLRAITEERYLLF